MSSSHTNLDLVKVQTPELDYRAPSSYTTIECPQTRSRMAHPASILNDNSIRVDLNPPNQRIGTDSVVLLKYQLQVLIPETQAGGDPYNELLEGLRQYPLHSVISNASLTINDMTFSTSVGDFVHPLMRVKSDWHDHNRSELSLCPSMPDSYQSYQDYVNLGQARHVFSQYGENSWYNTRNAIKPTTNNYPYVPNALQPAIRYRQLIFDITEPLLVSPLFFSGRNKALIGVDSMTLTLSLQNIRRMWCRAPNAPVPSPNINGGNINVSFVDTSFSAICTYYTPQSYQSIHSAIEYPYSNVHPLQGDNINLPAYALGNAGQSIRTNVRQFSSVPSKFIVYVSRSETEKLQSPHNTTDTFARLNKVYITWNGQENYFASLTAPELYMISVRNGLDMSWAEWNEYCGSIFVFSPEDLGLEAGLSAGVRGSFNFQCEVEAVSLDTRGQRSFRLHVLTVDDGIMKIEGGRTMVSEGILTKYDVLNAPVSHDISYYDVKSIGEKQGGFSFGNLLGKIGSIGGIANSVKSLMGNGGVYSKANKKGGRKISRAELHEAM